MSSNKTSSFVPWKVATILKHQKTLEAVIQKAFLPGDPAEALNSSQFCETTAALDSTAPCKICQCLHQLCTHHSPDLSFYGDYAIICYYALHAPKTMASNLMLLADCLELIQLYFPDAPSPPPNINGLDIYLHFFVNRCFRLANTEKIMEWSNLDMLKTEFLRATLSGSLSGAFCFKTLWPSLTRAPVRMADECTCTPITNPGCGLDGGKLFHPACIGKDNFLDLILIFWKNTDAMTPANSLLADTLSRHQVYFQNLTPVETNASLDPSPALDTTQGPCLLSPALCLQKKNHTSSLCLLCECLASHSEAASVFQTFKHLVLNSINNKVKLLDRILFLQQDADSLSFIQDRELLKSVLVNCSPQEIHKHLFCDPLCALNSSLTDSVVLFGEVPDFEFTAFKATLATGNSLVHRSFQSCEILETLILLFKSLQTVKANKTTVSEIIKEVDASLKKHKFSLLSCYYTFNIYT
ncbi:putative major envelope glycoprotein [Alcelaphine gammaherpesvirus 1]|uniref:Packaging protein UL32 homolog n=1 Tax=Alcelaphine herpesvirus 1 (strain C500) TaxID=654901 RepID=UL32_ALHV1|nr:putative major envelope glycoprotein [Alcelaphine gammaherpesvirus 1]O36419.1 RecName: Full=Packaging protein UL32 homolog [Alcelaphine herpesvirus 1 strain C500]AAC58116.1 putative major envelope glycoprotein [Alcelaphine gammaherpesvirus 1]APB09492.1 DNA packaging protein UL32 [Alcelaphine gammaherpesvirus 1]APB09564.1 DNA packaging protein UL32 [Alcelaphine gammaherpesvirus 1]ATI21955.1 ORF68 [Alcelaphine gammaherpesvirus 1]QDY92303.1 DNA packaging protein UL32 [Alcelaphine gammaherpesv